MDTCVLSLSLLRTLHVTARGVLRLVRVRDQLKCGERGAVARQLALARRPVARRTSTVL
jgi:hypothetical protein